MMRAVAIGSMTSALVVAACSSSTAEVPPPFEEPIVLPPRREGGAPSPFPAEARTRADTEDPTGAGDGGSDAADAAKPPRKAFGLALALDGLTVTVGGVAVQSPYLQRAQYWGPDAATPEEFELSVAFGAQEGGYYFTALVDVRAFRTGSGCNQGDNSITHRTHEGSYSPASGSACPLVITSVPRARGDRFSGTFSGTVTSYVTGKSKTLAISFGFTRSS